MVNESEFEKLPIGSYTKQMIYQENIVNGDEYKSDVRVICFNKNIIGAFLKQNKGIVTNIAKGGIGTNYILSPEEIIFTKHVMDVFNDFNLFGLDFIKDKNQNIYFLELNLFSAPVFCSITNINFYKIIIDHLFKKQNNMS